MCKSSYINTDRSYLLFLDHFVMNVVSAIYAINLKTFISKYVSNHIKAINVKKKQTEITLLPELRIFLKFQ